MTDQPQLPQPTNPPEEVKDFTFDLDKISFDEMMDILELADMKPDQYSAPALVGALKAMRKALVKGSKPLTGKDVMPVFQAFITYVVSGGEDSKN
jgi:hypothetical protein